MVNIADFHLKPISLDELKLVHQWRNSKRIASLMYSNHSITWEEHCKWFANVQKNPKVLVLICYYKQQALGVVNFTDINEQHKRCSWGFYIGEQSAPRGAGTMMGILALDEIFVNKNFHKVCAEVIESNSRSISYHRKLGFALEGRLVDHVWKNGDYTNVLQMALFSKDWPRIKKDLLEDKGGTDSGDN